MSMMYATGGVWFLLSVCALRLVSSTKFRARPGTKLVPDYVMDEPEVTSRLDCVTMCAPMTDCRSVSWSENLHQCLLSNEDPSIFWPVDKLNDYLPYLSLDSRWVTYSKLLYPVAFYYRSERYSLSYEAARQLCMDHDEVLATEEQLLAARAMGMNACGCGWMRNGTIGFVLQEVDWNCWGSFNDGIIDCGQFYTDFAAAWCTMH